MKQFKTLFLIHAMILLVISSVSQSQEVPGDWSRQPGEIQQFQGDRNAIPQNLLEQLAAAKRQHDNDAKERIGNEILKYIPQENSTDASRDRPVPNNTTNPPFNPDWYGTDVTVFAGNIAYVGGFRQIDLKQGEDGWMYVAINKRPITGTLGSLVVYRSSNGGATWAFVQGLDWGTRYIQSVSMLVENRSNTNFGDSTKIVLYYVTSLTSNFNDARLESVTFNRTGINWNYNLVSTPAAGNKYEYPSTCSDGMYWGTATYLHCVVREASNAGVQVGLRHFLSTTWTESHTSALLNTGWDDFYPSIQYGEKNTGTDSIYIATERRFSGTEYGLRLIATSEFISPSHFVYFVAFASGIKYEKPELTVVQQQYTLPRKMLITCTRARNPRFFYSTNGAQTWTVDQLMGTSSTVTADFTTCNSDSLTNGGQYVIMGFVTDDGDSVNVKQLTIPPGTTFSYYKRNNNISSGLVAPSTAIYKVGTVKYAAFSYPGSGPVNVYYNSEQLITAVEPIGNILPDKFELSQNYPNPFNPSTKINFSIPKTGMVKLVVYDMLGKQVSELLNGNYNAGSYKVDFNASVLSSGVYFYKIEAEGFTDVKKMMLVK
ncbi:MAG: T9SS type A sorting domain-containing protein [Ignavibacteria bacterium]